MQVDAKNTTSVSYRVIWMWLYAIQIDIIILLDTHANGRCILESGASALERVIYVGTGPDSFATEELSSSTACATGTKYEPTLRRETSRMKVMSSTSNVMNKLYRVT